MIKVEEQKHCVYCKLPLVLFDIEIDPDGIKRYKHNHCGNVVKTELSEVKKELKPCPSCGVDCQHIIYETGVFTFACNDCDSRGAGGFGGGGGAGSGGTSHL